MGQDAHAHILGRIHQEVLKYNQSQVVNLHCESGGWKQVAGAAWCLYPGRFLLSALRVLRILLAIVRLCDRTGPNGLRNNLCWVVWKEAPLWDSGYLETLFV